MPLLFTWFNGMCSFRSERSNDMCMVPIERPTCIFCTCGMHVSMIDVMMCQRFVTDLSTLQPYGCMHGADHGPTDE